MGSPFGRGFMPPLTCFLARRNRQHLGAVLCSRELGKGALPRHVAGWQRKRQQCGFHGQKHPYHSGPLINSLVPRSNSKQAGREERLQSILRSVGLESYAAHITAWVNLGATGALRLNEGRAAQHYGRSLKRLIFLITDPDVAQTWYRT